MTIRGGAEYGLYQLSCALQDRRIADSDLRVIAKLIFNSRRN